MGMPVTTPMRKFTAKILAQNREASLYRWLPVLSATDFSTTISSDQAGAAPRFAVPDFIALSKDAETVDAAQTIGRVLWDDLNFEREFALIPRDVVATILDGGRFAVIQDLQIDRPDITDPFLGIVNPDEDITFSSMFIPAARARGGAWERRRGSDRRRWRRTP